MNKNIIIVALTGLLTIEKRDGKDEIVIEKALVETGSEAFKYYIKRREKWAAEDRFSSPGPRQFWGPVANRIPKSIYLNKGLENINSNFKHKALYLFQQALEISPQIVGEQLSIVFDKSQLYFN